MPPIKTLSAREVFQQSPRKLVSEDSSLPKSTAPKQARIQSRSSVKPSTSSHSASSHLTAAQFLQSAKAKTIKKKSAPATEISSEAEPKTQAEKGLGTRKSAPQPLLSPEALTSPRLQSKVAQSGIEKPPLDNQSAGNATLKKLPSEKISKTKASNLKGALHLKNKSPETITQKAEGEKKKPKPAALPKPVSAVTPVSVVKAKRSRVPKDFAQTYGENVKERKVEIVPTRERRARKTAQQRESLRALMTPDDDIIRRLSQTSVTPIKSTLKRRSKKWESRCGKCGVVTAFVTNAALCSRCGAITVRVLD